MRKDTIVALVAWTWCVPLAAQPVSPEKVLNFAIGEWPPYTSQRTVGGQFAEKVVAACFALEGYTVKFHYLPWKRSYLVAESGTFDGTFPWVHTAERERSFFYPKQALMRDTNVFFHLRRTPFDWKRLEDLKNYKVGITLGYRQEASYAALGIASETASSEEVNFRKLLHGRIAVYETSRSVGFATLEANFSPSEIAQITYHPKAVDDLLYYVLLSRKSPRGAAVAQSFDACMTQLKSEGTYKRLLSDLPRVAPH